MLHKALATEADEGNKFLASIEADHASKLSLLSGAMWGWDIRMRGVGLKGSDANREGYRAAASLFDWSRYTPHFVAVPKDSNCGWPLFTAGAGAKLIMAIAAVAGSFRVQATRDELKAIASKVAAREEAHCVLFARSGPIAKPQPAYDRIGPSIIHTADIVGIAPRRRAVNGVSTADNLCLLSQAKGIQNVLVGRPEFSHTTSVLTLDKIKSMVRAVRSSGGDPIILEDDISAFDLSVTGLHQQALAEEVYSKVWSQAEMSDWLAVQWQPLLAPPVDLRFKGTLYRRPMGGETTSGMITTSLDGNFHNLARLLSSLAAGYSITLSEVCRRIGNSINFLAWGDDTLLVVDGRSFDREAYMARSAEIGYTCKLRGNKLQGATFLAIFYDTEKWQWQGLASRVLQNTVFRERRTNGPASELAGLYFRSLPRQVYLNEYLVPVWRIITETSDLLPRWGVRSPGDLSALMVNHRFQRELKREMDEAGAVEARRLILDLRLRGSMGDASATAYESLLTTLLGADNNAVTAIEPDVDVIEMTAGLDKTAAKSMMRTIVSEMDESGGIPSVVKKMLKAESSNIDATTNDAGE